MVKISLNPPLFPRDGKTLRVILIDRISGDNQDPRSNADQAALLTQWVTDRYDGPVDWTRVTGKGAGENLERAQVLEAERLVERGVHDLVMLEDLGRHTRRMHAYLFCEQCEDRSVRLIAINDSVDTVNSWRLNAVFAAMKHEQANKDTSERIKRSLRNRFKQGGIVQTTIFGYLKPAGAESDADLQKDPTAEPIYDEWFRMLEAGASYSEVADWLNRREIPTGRYCRSRSWCCKMVARITKNPILKGVRERNRRKSKRVNKTGRYASVPAAPGDLLERRCPHLAFIDPERYDRLMRLLKTRNGRYKPGGADGDPRAGRPKKRTIWPGQHMYCGVCGGLLRYGGHGQNDHLLCRGAYEYRCWNAITVDGPLASRKMSQAILAEVESLADYGEALRLRVLEEAQQMDSTHDVRRKELERKIDELNRSIQHLVNYIQEGHSQSVRRELELQEARRDAMSGELDEVRKESRNGLTLPPVEEIKQLARQAMARQADDPYEFGRLMRSLIPRIVVWPYRLCDGDRIFLRAQFSLCLAPLVSSLPVSPALLSSLRRELMVDLAELPQRVLFRRQVVEMRAADLTEAQIAKQLGITKTAVQGAASLNREMLRRSLEDPYVPLDSPQSGCGKLRRHLHPRYSFRPFTEPTADS